MLDWKSNYKWYWCERYIKVAKYFQNLLQFLWCKTAKSCLLSWSRYFSLNTWYISRHICFWYCKRQFLRIMLLYHCPRSSPVMFYNTLENLLSDSKITAAVLGDFNIDVLSSANVNLQHALSNYTFLTMT